MVWLDSAVYEVTVRHNFTSGDTTMQFVRLKELNMLPSLQLVYIGTTVSIWDRFYQNIK